MGTIRFEMRKEKQDKEGKAPIRIIYQLHGQRKYYSTGIKTFVENWDDINQEVNFNVYVENEKGEKVKVKSKLLKLEADKLNADLQVFVRDIKKIERRFEDAGVVYSPEMVMDELKTKDAPKTKKDVSSNEVYEFIDRYIADHEFLRVKGSLSVYKSLNTHLKAYEKKRGKKITFEKMDYAFFQGFNNFLVMPKKVKKKVIQLNDITIAKQLSTLKTLLNYAKAQGIDVSTKYESFKIKRENDLEVIALTNAEFEAVYNMDLSKKPAWDRVRDVFIFSCSTGLRFSDLMQLSREHIKNNKVDLTAIKTSHKTKIPLNPYSRAILEKYKTDEKPLPVISNQRSNEHIKNICDWAGINEPIEIVRNHGNKRVAKVYKKYELIGMHCGRKTFASLSLERGMRAEYVMKIGGWRDYKSFKRYLNLTDDSTDVAMDAAWGAKVIKSKLKAV